MQGTINAVGDEIRGPDSLIVQADQAKACYDLYINRFATELAKHESRTKEDYEWRKNTLKQWAEIDSHDKLRWHKATIVEIREVEENQRKYTEVRVGFRVYRENNA